MIFPPLTSTWYSSLDVVSLILLDFSVALDRDEHFLLHKFLSFSDLCDSILSTKRKNILKLCLVSIVDSFFFPPCLTIKYCLPDVPVDILFSDVWLQLPLLSMLQTKPHVKSFFRGTSLAVQQLRLHTFTSGGAVSVPHWGT